MKIEVVECSSGFDAIEEIKMNGLPDAIYIDYRMPEMNGIDTIKEIKKLHPDAKLFLLSAATEITEEATLAGATGFISKPIIKANLIDITKKILNGV
jgi:Response regulator containing CheY-like receiver domain and AraC-type DNA-binding domain